jgi:hypothetical protein
MKFSYSILATGLALAAAALPAHALTLDLLETPDVPTTILPAALLGASSGISIVGGSVSFVGDVGDGINHNTAQSATYTGFNLVPSLAGFPTISQTDGIFLTSGTANIPFTNTDTSFDPNIPATGGDAQLTAILVAASAPSTAVNDVNYLQFSFTTAAGMTSVEANFVFGSDEFPDQGVTDVFAFIVDGKNYAFFQDGSLVSFVTGVNAANFNNNNFFSTVNYPIEYDGISNSLHVVGLLDPNLTTHTLKIAIGDTSDSIFDSGVFIGGLAAGTGTGGGINPTPEPASLALLGIGLAGLGAMRRKQRA